MSDEQKPKMPLSTPPQVRAWNVKGLRSRWLCPNGHTLGVVLHEKRDSRDITYLCKFPFALTDDDYVPESIIVSKIYSGSIGCTICGAARNWAPEKPGKKGEKC